MYENLTTYAVLFIGTAYHTLGDNVTFESNVISLLFTNCAIGDVIGVVKVITSSTEVGFVNAFVETVTFASALIVCVVRTIGELLASTANTLIPGTP
jgi:hypothetical protein